MVTHALTLYLLSYCVHVRGRCNSLHCISIGRLGVEKSSSVMQLVLVNLPIVHTRTYLPMLGFNFVDKWTRYS